MKNCKLKEKNDKFEITPTVAIVGRPNVGKSALFNAIIGKRVSIVHEESGVTRDNIIAPVKIQGNYLQLIDTGGLGMGKTKALKRTSFFDAKICTQVEVAIDSADVLLFVVDVTTGVTPLDEEVATTLRESGKKIILIVNKTDNSELEGNLTEFARLNIEEILPVSCLHRRGLKRVSETISKHIWKSKQPPEEKRLAITVVGRPNVGKSSIINKLTGKNRVIVSDIAGTTRDAIDLPVDLNVNDELIPANLIDTAGLRKRGKANSAIEIFSVMRAQTAIERSDIVILVIEADKYGPTSQDAHIGKIISDCGKGCIIVANKWDACSGLKQKDITKEIRGKLPFLAYAPIVYSCAISGYNFNAIMNEIYVVNEQYKIKIPTSTVNKVLSDAITYNPPPCVKSRFLKIFYATMVANKPPLFCLFVNDTKLCTKNYQAYLKNYLRKNFNLHGLPIHLKFKPRVNKRK
jgi:GTPase